jgi:hypothetical protein
MRIVLLILLVVLAAAGCSGVSAPQVQLSGPNPPEACIDRFSGNVARTCR